MTYQIGNNFVQVAIVKIDSFQKFMQYIEDALPMVKYQGLNTQKAVTMESTLAVTGAITATGGVAGAVSGTLTGAVAGTTVSASGLINAKSAAAVPATAGAVAAGIPFTFFNNGPSLYVTSDAPTHTAVKGSLCINTAGASTSTRLYVSDGGTTWIAVTTAS